MAFKFKTGDKIKCKGNTGSHGIIIGDTCTVMATHTPNNTTPTLNQYLICHAGANKYMYEQDMEHVNPEYSRTMLNERKSELHQELDQIQHQLDVLTEANVDRMTKLEIGVYLALKAVKSDVPIIDQTREIAKLLQI